MSKTIIDMQDMKNRGEKITMITCYDSSFARIIDQTNIDCILVGDSLGNTMLGYDNTLRVTIDDIIRYTSSVVRANQKQFIIADLPFMSYHTSLNETVENAGRIIKESGAHAIKLEGGRDFAEEIRAITRAQIPVISHLGLTPQSVNVFGGYKVQGKTLDSAKTIIEDAKIVQDAGAKMLVLEGIPSDLGDSISKNLEIPVIGIGAGKCDGQVLVMQDLLGMNSNVPKFVKKYANLDKIIKVAFNKYAQEVKNSDFPNDDYSYSSSNNTENKESISRLY